jgi:hypothetical protein
MKVYLSQPMTKATPHCKGRAAYARACLTVAKIDMYDPPTMEPAGKTIAELQDIDFKEMRGCDAVLVVWTAATIESRGCNAEMEWARRNFKIPVFVWLASPDDGLEAWPDATVRTSGGNIHVDLSTLILEMVKFNDVRSHRRKSS